MMNQKFKKAADVSCWVCFLGILLSVYHHLFFLDIFHNLSQTLYFRIKNKILTQCYLCFKCCFQLTRHVCRLKKKHIMCEICKCFFAANLLLG